MPTEKERLKLWADFRYCFFWDNKRGGASYALLGTAQHYVQVGSPTGYGGLVA